jgi:hypothetical protein
MRTSSGKILAAVPQDYRLLSVGGRYLLFLERHADGDYFIRQGYALKTPIHALNATTEALPEAVLNDE